jgi:hypothetical protein
MKNGNRRPRGALALSLALSLAFAFNIVIILFVTFFCFDTALSVGRFFSIILSSVGSHLFFSFSLHSKDCL